jgi:hypothetical protein
VWGADNFRLVIDAVKAQMEAPEKRLDKKLNVGRAMSLPVALCARLDVARLKLCRRSSGTRARTEGYVDEIDLDELAEALGRAAAHRRAQASPDLTTLEMELTEELRELE